MSPDGPDTTLGWSGTTVILHTVVARGTLFPLTFHSVMGIMEETGESKSKFGLLHVSSPNNQLMTIGRSSTSVTLALAKIHCATER